MISIVTVVELQAGVYTDVGLIAERQSYLTSFLSTVEIVDFGLEAAAAYGRIIAQLGYSRKQVLDRMIAATAIVHGATVVTANTADFHGIKGLQLRRW